MGSTIGDFARGVASRAEDVVTRDYGEAKKRLKNVARGAKWDYRYYTGQRKSPKSKRSSSRSGR